MNVLKGIGINKGNEFKTSYMFHIITTPSVGFAQFAVLVCISSASTPVVEALFGRAARRRAAAAPEIQIK